MSTHEFMRSDYPAHGPSKPAKTAAPRKRRSALELVLTGAALLAWSWCIYEIALLFIS